MRMKRMPAILATIVIAVAGGDVAAQTNAPTPAQADNGARNMRSQTDVSLSIYEAFTSSTSGNGTDQTPSNGPGGLLEVRHIRKPLLGFELTYSFNRAAQAYTPTVGNCGFLCGNQPIKNSASASEVSVDYVASKGFGRLRPFVIGGMGFFITVPAVSDINYLNTVVRMAYVYGGGVDVAFSPRVGMRVQCRGNLYKAPNLSPFFNPTGAFTETVEPMAGLYYSF